VNAVVVRCSDPEHTLTRSDRGDVVIADDPAEAARGHQHEARRRVEHEDQRLRDSVVGKFADRFQVESVPVEVVRADPVSDRQADEQRVVHHVGPLDSVEPPDVRSVRRTKLIGHCGIGGSAPSEAMSCARPRGRREMGASHIQQLRALEGRRVGVAVRGGRRIDECELISAGRGRARTLWVFVDGGDAFVALDDVVDFWETA
jgi:hypothetical protein